MPKLLHGIDITTPGGIEALMAFHRRTFGDAVMEHSTSTAEAGEQHGQSDEFKAPATQEELNRIIQSRLDRERRTIEAKYADYDDLKAKAQKADELESKVSGLESEKTELSTKVQGFEAEKERAQLVADVADESGIPANALRGGTREELEAHADILKPFFSTSGPVIPGQEKTPSKVEDDPLREFTRGLFNDKE